MKPLHRITVALTLAAFLPLPAAARAQTADQTVTAVVAELSKGNPKALWDAMPASYQKDVADVIHAAAGKIEPGVYNKLGTLLTKATGLLKNKKDFVLGSKFLADNPKKDELAKNYDGMVALAQTLVDSELTQIEKMKTLEPGAFLGTTGAKIMQQVQTLALASGEDLYAKIAATKATAKGQAANGNAIVTMSHPDEGDEDVEFKLVEGKWVPAEIADEWAAQVAEAKATIDAIDPQAQQQQSMQALMVMTMVEGMIDQLAATQTQEQFDQTIEALMGAFGGGAAPAPAEPADPDAPVQG